MEIVDLHLINSGSMPEHKILRKHIWKLMKFHGIPLENWNNKNNVMNLTV